MGLPTHNLDDRTFQDIVDEAKKRIGAACPTWTDHNVSDPGITLVELFAWMTEMILYRLNQLPDRHYVKLLELMGLRLGEAEPAKTDLTFYLAAPQPTAVPIPAGREVSTLPSEGSPAVIFTTDTDRVIRPLGEGDRPVMFSGTGDDGRGWPPEGEIVRLPISAVGGTQKNKFKVFGVAPQVGTSWYFGFDVDVSWHVIELEVVVETMPQGVIPKDPPWEWEAWGVGAQASGTRLLKPGWQTAVIDRRREDLDGPPPEEPLSREIVDTTGGLTQSGKIRLRLPQMTANTFPKSGERALRWLRCRITGGNEGSAFTTSPEVSGVNVRTRGVTVGATHAQVIRNEILGISDGSAGQVYQLQNRPVLRRVNGDADEVVEVHALSNGADGSAFEAWAETEGAWSHLPDEDLRDRPHYMLDRRTGEVSFGPALRDRTGKVVPYGKIPPRGAQIRIRKYRIGGGVIGNVRQDALSVLREAIPYVEKVTNHEDAAGGMDPESVEKAKLRAPALRTHDRAVTLSDFEVLALKADTRVGRVKCIQSPETRRENVVSVVVVPRVQRPDRYLTFEQLKPDADLLATVERELDKRRLLTVRVEARGPQYVWVTVAMRVKARDGQSRPEVQRKVKQKLDTYINPLVGGPEKRGWPFGREFRPAEILGWPEAFPELGIRHIEEFSIKKTVYKDDGTVQHEEEQSQGEAALAVYELVPHAVLASGQHVVTVE